jgi:antitoxin PrlF
MESMQITTMSSRGQIVIPQALRDVLALGEGAKFLILGEGDTIILKRLEVPSTDELRALLAHSRQIAKKGKLKKSDLKRVIAQERKKS